MYCQNCRRVYGSLEYRVKNRYTNSTFNFNFTIWCGKNNSHQTMVNPPRLSRSRRSPFVKPRSHSLVLRWIRNPLSLDAGVQIPFSALHHSSSDVVGHTSSLEEFPVMCDIAIPISKPEAVMIAVNTTARCTMFEKNWACIEPLFSISNSP